jgi:FMN-dependent oxidoreductase (nitrilotriacetate monooxygenase family)
MSTKPVKQVHLAAHFPGVNSTTVWNDPASGSQIDFASFEHFARAAERGRFDYLFLAEGLRLREHRGRIYDLDVAGRPNTLAILGAIAAVTRHIGLVGTLTSTYNEPYELARQLQTLDLLSGGRAGWNVVTSPDAFTGANFRRGGFLDYADRYLRSAEFIDVAREVWDAWRPGAVVADSAAGRYFADDALRRIDHHGPQFDVAGYGTLPRSRQRHPVIVQAGDSAAGRDFAASHAELVFSRHVAFDDGRAFYEDVKSRLAAHGRDRGDLKILPAMTFVLGDTDAEARERSREIALQQVSPQTSIAFLERTWGRDLSGYDPDGPLPEIEPESGDTGVSRGRAQSGRADPVATVRRWRELAATERLSIRELVIRVSTEHSFVGTPRHVAEEINRYVQGDAADGFVVIGHLTPTGLDEFAATVIPELQERGVFRTEYPEGATLRDLLGVRAPVPASYEPEGVPGA